MDIEIESKRYHIVFALKNSRYELQKIKRKKITGFIANTYPMIEGKEEEIIIEVLCKVAKELDLRLIAFNYCGDHVHCIMSSMEESISKAMLLWKGKSAYEFKRHPNHEVKLENTNNNEGIWAKSYFIKEIKDEIELINTISYIKNNRLKHNLNPLSKKSLTNINNIISK